MCVDVVKNGVNTNMKFKIGDTVRVIKSITKDGRYFKEGAGAIGKIFTVESINQTENINYPYLLIGDNFARLEEELELITIKNMKPNKKTKKEKTNFVLTYDVNNSDPAETFTTKEQVSSRIKELVDQGGNTNFRVFEVKKELKVVVNKVTIK